MKYRCTAPDSPLFGQTFDIPAVGAEGAVHLRGRLWYDREAFRKDFTPVNEVDDFKLKHAALIHGVVKLNVQCKNLESQLKDRKAALLDLMEAAHIDKVVACGHTISAREDANTVQFQTAAFKKAYPDLYRRFTKSNYRESYLVITGRYDKDEV